MIAGDTGDIAARIYSYMAGIVKEYGAVSLSINGMPDHVHLLIKSSKSVSNSDSCVPSGRLTILNQSPRIEIRGC